MADREIERLTKEVQKYAKRILKESRYKHSLRVSRTAVRMCSLFGCDGGKARLAGVGHDICKDLPDSEILTLAARDGGALSGIEQAKPSLLHGRAAAIVLREKFAIDDRDVLEAVANHTFGRAGLCPLAKVIYVADKIEPGRPQSTAQYRKRLYSMTLNQMALCVLEENLEYLRSKGREIAPATRDFELELKQLVFAGRAI